MRHSALVAGLGTGLGLLSLAAATAATAGADAASALEPYQIVRSLELVQDRLALGDHASQPMQHRLLEMIDASFATKEGSRFENHLNRRALLVYAMSGGNPATVEAAIARLGRDDPSRLLGEKILFYVNGKPKEALEAFSSVDPMAYSPGVAMYLALVKGSMLVDSEPARALAVLDRARLLGPGTLVEEAALRRSLAAATALGDAARFQRLAEQYVHTYLRSPYAGQFADAFVAGVVALHQTIDRRVVADIAALMDSEQEKVIYLRIARQAAIEGLIDLASFAATQAEGIADDPRAELYSSLSSVTSDNIPQVLGNLARIERDRLSDNDRQLLDAVRAIATGLTTAPAGMRPGSDDSAPAVRPIRPYQPDAPAPTVDEPVAAGADAPAPSRNRGPSKGVDVSVERARATVAATRAKLANIDKVIGEMPQ